MISYNQTSKTTTKNKAHSYKPPILVLRWMGSRPALDEASSYAGQDRTQRWVQFHAAQDEGCTQVTSVRLNLLETPNQQNPKTASTSTEGTYHTNIQKVTKMEV